MINGKLRPKHAASVSFWSRVIYDPRKPGEWPGGPLMDSRTSHETRRLDWERKTADQITMIKGFCRDGRNCGEVEGS